MTTSLTVSANAPESLNSKTATSNKAVLESPFGHLSHETE